MERTVMSSRLLNRLTKIEHRLRPREERQPEFQWSMAALGECEAAHPLLEVIAQRAVDRALHGAPATFWPVDDPALWPALEAFRNWFNGRFPGRWDEIGCPFPEQLPDGSWRSRE